MALIIKAPTEEHQWTVPENLHQIIVNNLPNNKIFKGVVANRLLNGLKGYSPADAVQDFKNHSKYALKYGGYVYTGRNSHIEKEGGKIR